MYRLKQEFPELTIVINGGIDTAAHAQAHLERVDGVMLGRTAYHDSFRLAEIDALVFGGATISREEVTVRLAAYAREEIARGEPLRAITRHMLGLFHGQPRARLWRQLLSDAARLAHNDAGLLLEALDAVSPSARAA